MTYIPPKYTPELASPPFPVARGMTGPAVRRLQEWLTLWGYVTGCDGDFGPATEQALKNFKWEQIVKQGDRSRIDGSVDDTVWNTLLMPIHRATAMPSIVDSKHFGQNVTRVARQYLVERAREAGGDNRGPWQRHFARGRENQPWCQDFASTVWFDAARAQQLSTLPFALCDSNNTPNSYVPWVVLQAKAAAKFRPAEDPALVPPGSMFFLRSGASWSHVGIVVTDDGTVVQTIEGNTNAGGSPNGYEVASRTRARSSCDFGLSE